MSQGQRGARAASAPPTPRQPARAGDESPPVLAPTAEQPSTFARFVRNLLPERSEEDRVAQIVRISIGRGKQRQEYALDVLSIKQNAEWKALFAKEIGGVLDRLSDQADGMAVVNFLNSLTSQQLLMVQAYDLDHVLPDLEENATEPQLLTAFLAVTAAAYPFAEAAIAALQESNDLRAMLRLELWRSMNISLPGTDGAPVPSAIN